MKITLSGNRVALALSGLALLIALSGTAYAANTVRSVDIVNGTIKSEDIGTAQVKSIDVMQGTLLPADHAAGGLGSVPRVMGRVNADGTEAFGNIDSTNQIAGDGLYVIQAGRDVAGCVVVATPRSADRSIASDTASTTAVNVYVRDADGNFAEGAFDIAFFC